MKRKFTLLLTAFTLLVFLSPIVAWGGVKLADTQRITQKATHETMLEAPDEGEGTRAEVSLVALTFPDNNSANNKVGSYTDTWTATIGTYSWSIANFNNNNWNKWNYIKCGRKNNASVASITNAAAISEAITKVSVTIDEITASKVNSIKLYTSSNGSSWTEAGTYTKATGEQTVTLTTPTANLYYKIEFDCASGSSNGLVTVSKVEYYYNEGTPTVATPTFDPNGGTYTEEQLVEISCTTEGATIYYTIDGNDPTDESTAYDSNEGVTIDETTTLKAIAYVGSDYSSVATATYTILSMQTIAEARAQGTGNVYTQGTVTSISGTSAFIQDATAAINVYGNGDLEVGKKYSVVGTLTDYNGLLEITSPTCTEVAGGSVIAPEVMTIADILTSENQGWFIKVEGATVGSTSNNNTTLTQNGSSIIARYLSGAEEGDVINLTGNIGRYNQNNQIANPLVVVGPSIAVDETELSFSYVVGGSAEAQTLAITGQNLTEGIGVALSQEGNYFAVSADEENWATSLTLPAEGDAIVVRLNPGLAHGAYSGTLTFTSEGATAVTVSLTGSVTNQTYAITLNPNDGGTIAADKETAEAGETVTLTATPATGYAFGTWTVLDGDANAVTVNNNQFVMPASAVEVEGSFVQQSYDITVAATTNGTVVCEDQTTHYGETVMVTVTPAEGYRVASFTVAETNGTATVTEIEVAEEIYSFTMPAYNVTITVAFEVQPDVYDGTGTFTKVTSLDDLEDGGYYVIYSTKAMNSTLSDGAMGATEVSLVNGTFVNPAKSIVWKLEAAEDNKWNLYSEVIEKYCFINGNKTTSFATGVESTYSYTITVNSEGGFTFASTHTNGRCISLSTDGNSFRSFAASNNPTVELYKLGEPSTDPIITVAQPTENVPASPEFNGTLALTYANLEISGMEDFGVQFYDAEEQELQAAPEGFEVLVAAEDPSVGEGYVVSYTVQPNTQTQERVARFKVYVGEVFSNLVTITQDAYVEPFELVTYTLATTIESGRHYIIVNEGSSKAMGGQNSNNRAAVDVEIENGVATVSSADVYEFVINGPDIITKNDQSVEVYTIYDARYVHNDELTGGFLYAASGSSNHLKTETHLDTDNNALWTIAFDSENHAVITAQGTNSRNLMRFNSQSNLFSCYGDGQQPIYLYVKDETAPQYDFYKDIAGYGTGSGKYYLITSPVETADPVEVGMITDDNTNPENFSYDLYWFDQTQTEEWQNARQVESMSLVSGNLGYLYANKNNVTLHFTGTPNDVASVSLVKSDNDNVDWSGWNLVGNPFTVPAYIDRSFYRMNEDGTELIEGSGAINPMEGIFVIANANDEEMTFGTTAPTNVDPDVVVNVTNESKVIDRAVVRFNNGGLLPKFQLNPNHTKVYITEANQEYAVVRSANQGEMPVSFKAAENGTYTLTVNPEGVEMNYLHLIDNMTGADVDLLATPSYTFEANTTDYASRFRLVFSANNVDENGASTSSATFAYFNGSNWTVSNTGDATLQVVDVMGRVLSSETLSGNATVSLNQPAGVYMLRLVNGNDVKVQKVVVR